MTTRHPARAVILLGGWLLLTPPFDMGKGDPPHLTLRSGVPIEEWDQESAFDTARECEAARAKLGAQVERGKNGKIDQNNRVFFMALTAAARCVPADGIYPPKSPPQK